MLEGIGEGEMKRHNFSPMVMLLLQWIINKGWYAIIGHAERSKEEQKRMFEAGLSKCDGETIISAHQYRDAGGRYAIDIMIHDGDFNIDKKALYEEAHDYWDSIGGSARIPWDMNHWEAQ